MKKEQVIAVQKSNRKTVEFTKAFANKKKGDVIECDSMLANTLVKEDKVAKYVKEEDKDLL